MEIDMESIEDIVAMLNSEIYDCTNNEELIAFTFSGNGLCAGVDFLGQQFWSSEDNVPTEQLESHLRTEAMKLITIIGEIRL